MEGEGLAKGPQPDHDDKANSSSSNGNPSPLNLVLGRLSGVHRSGPGWSALCPYHDDRSPSLSVREGDGGRILLHCHAGCSSHDVVQAMGLAWSDLYVAGSRERLRPRVWKGITPMNPQGRPALESFGDDVLAAMLAEVGRVAYARNELDQKALDALNLLATACGSSKASVREHLAAAVAGDAA